MPKTLTDHRKYYQNWCQADNKSTKKQSCVLGEFGARKKHRVPYRCAYDMVPLRADWKVEFLRRGYPRLSAGALQIRVPKGRRLMNKSQNGSAKVPKATNIEPKECPKQPTMNQKGANMIKSCFKIKPRSVRNVSFFSLSFFAKVVKTVTAQVLPMEKVHVWSTPFYCLKKVSKWFLALEVLLR